MAKSVKIFTKSLKIWENSLKIRVKNGAQRLQNYIKTFFRGHSKGLSLWETVVAQKRLGQVWENSGKNPSIPKNLPALTLMGYLQSYISLMLIEKIIFNLRDTQKLF